MRVLLPSSCCCSVIKSYPTLCNPIDCSTPGFPVFISWSLLKFISIESMMLSNHLILYHPFSFCHQSFPASGSFPMIWLFASGDQSIGASALAEYSFISPSNEYWVLISFRLTALISLLFKQLSRIFSSTTVWKHQFLGAQLSLWSNSHIVHDYWKNHSFDYTELCLQSDVSAFFNMLSRFVIAFLPRSKCLLISRLQA